MSDCEAVAIGFAGGGTVTQKEKMRSAVQEVHE